MRFHHTNWQSAGRAPSSESLFYGGFLLHMWESPPIANQLQGSAVNTSAMSVEMQV